MKAAFARGFLFGWLGLALWGCSRVSESAAGYAPTPAERQLVFLIGKRLSYAPDVAWFKYQRKLPIADPVRETAVRNALRAEGRRLGVPDAVVTGFFTAQMAASRELQSEITAAWNQGTAPPRDSQADLEKEIRPRLSELSRQMLARLADPAVKRSPALAEYADQFLRRREYSPPVARTASASLK